MRQSRKFRKLCYLEPRIEKLYKAAQMIGDDGAGRWFCTNLIWYTLFKPRLYDLVGFGRRAIREMRQRERQDPNNPFRNNFYSEEELDPMTAEEVEFLESSEAWCLAVDTIRRQLPQCRDCGCP